MSLDVDISRSLRYSHQDFIENQFVRNSVSDFLKSFDVESKVAIPKRLRKPSMGYTFLLVKTITTEGETQFRRQKKKKEEEGAISNHR